MKRAVAFESAVLFLLAVDCGFRMIVAEPPVVDYKGMPVACEY